MNYWANLLHFYQPYGQKREIIDMIVAQCYRPVIEDILEHPRARMTFNFTGVLLDQLDEYGHRDVIDMYGEALQRGQIELVGSAKYHTILPLLSHKEAARQISINFNTGRKYFGQTFAPKGIFLPEMAWDPALGPIIEDAGYEWVMLDELAMSGHVGEVDYTRSYQLDGTKLGIIFREHRLSATLMNAVPRDIERLKVAADINYTTSRYIVCGMDGETFGHHRVGHERILTQLYEDRDVAMVRMSDLAAHFPEKFSVSTMACTWASSEDDIAQGIQFISWKDPNNEIHAMQWKLLHMAVAAVDSLDRSDSKYDTIRRQLDWAEASDQMFWAAARPWWMIEHIERGAHDLLEIIRGVPGIASTTQSQASGLYQSIMATAWDWQRSGKIDRMHEDRKQLVRIPFKSATLETGDQATWNSYMELVRDLELEAAARRDYEEARLWRDAAYKLEQKLDLYDLHYVIDILHHKVPAGTVERVLAKHRGKFDQIRGGQVEQRSN